jgi:hypothetical protein
VAAEVSPRKANRKASPSIESRRRVGAGVQKSSNAVSARNEEVQEEMRDCSKRKDDTTRMQSTDHTI